ncbi:GFA family protein [Sphingobium aquiterrae]|uniref:GFA family protein n=1 Tax=Sphingobium aquiterrae TaxID=2038656 RepID=UPI00301810A6
MADRSIHGAGCLCGAVRMTIAADPIAARICWCRLCQYLAAGSGTVNIIFPTEEVVIGGDVHWYESIADSGNRMRRGFCPQCGTPLLSLAESRPHLTIIRAGALDDPDLIAPQAIIWAKEAPAWAQLDPDLPHHEAQMPPAG